MKLEDYLKSRRLELGLTLNDVAERVGVAVSTVSRWEQGDIKNMKRNRVAKYAEALQIDPSVIMGWRWDLHWVFIISLFFGQNRYF